MNPNACRIVLRPRGPLEVFDLAVRQLRTHAGVFLRLLATLVVPTAVLAVPLCWATDGHWALLVAAVVFAPWLQAPATVLSGRLLFADRVRVRDVLQEVLRRWLPTSAAALQQLTAQLLGCAVVSWLTAVPVVFTLEAALLEQVGPARGLRRSFGLSLANIGVAVAAVAGGYFLTGWGAVVGEATGQALTGTVLQLGQPFGNAFEGTVTPFLLVGVVAIQPVVAVYRLMLYVDARTRIEGWDLQVELRAAAIDTAEPRPAEGSA